MIDFDSPYHLRPEQIEHFRDQGYLRLKNVFPGDVIAYIKAELSAAVSRRYEDLHTTGIAGKSYTQMFNVWVDSPGIRGLTFSQRIGRLTAELLNVTGVRLIHDQALFKEPGDSESVWHADQHYWPLDSNRACSIWIPLQATSLAMGPVAFAARSHSFAGRSVGGDRPLDTRESDAEIRRVIEERGYEIILRPYDLGEISIHAGWTFHHAGANCTDKVRKVYVLHLMDENTRLCAPVNPEQEGHIELFFWGGVDVGATLAVPMCPLLFSLSAEQGTSARAMFP